MQLAHEKKGNVVIVKPLEKRMDAVIAADFREEMEAFIKDGQTLFILDMSEIDFVDSSGLGAIMACLRMLGGKGDLMIAGARGNVTSLIKLTRMDRVFQLFANCDEALAGFPAENR